jgi:hypothetical protein
MDTKIYFVRSHQHALAPSDFLPVEARETGVIIDLFDENGNVCSCSELFPSFNWNKYCSISPHTCATTREDPNGVKGIRIVKVIIQDISTCRVLEAEIPEEKVLLCDRETADKYHWCDNMF